MRKLVFYGEPGSLYVTKVRYSDLSVLLKAFVCFTIYFEEYTNELIIVHFRNTSLLIIIPPPSLQSAFLPSSSSCSMIQVPPQGEGKG